MTDLRKAAEMALDTLDIYREHNEENIGLADAAYEALRQALAEPEQANFNKLIRIMGTFDLATGHADSWDELLDSLESELRDVLGYHREALRQALAQPECVDAVNMSQERVDETAKDRHEPVAWVNHDKDGEIEWGRNGYRLPVGTPLYTAPPKREWVELDVNEVVEVIHKNIPNPTPELLDKLYGLVADIDLWLQEKNA